MYHKRWVNYNFDPHLYLSCNIRPLILQIFFNFILLVLSFPYLIVIVKIVSCDKRFATRHVRCHFFEINNNVLNQNIILFNLKNNKLKSAQKGVSSWVDDYTLIANAVNCIIVSCKQINCINWGSRLQRICLKRQIRV